MSPTFSINDTTYTATTSGDYKAITVHLNAGKTLVTVSGFTSYVNMSLKVELTKADEVVDNSGSEESSEATITTGEGTWDSPYVVTSAGKISYTAVGDEDPDTIYKLQLTAGTYTISVNKSGFASLVELNGQSQSYNGPITVTIVDGQDTYFAVWIQENVEITIEAAESANDDSQAFTKDLTFATSSTILDVKFTPSESGTYTFKLTSTDAYFVSLYYTEDGVNHTISYYSDDEVEDGELELEAGTEYTYKVTTMSACSAVLTIEKKA
jgi:hypothetical protein